MIPAWKKLVEDLSTEGYESPYLDRLRRRLDVAQAQHELEKEILKEMASALGRAEDKVNEALLRLELLGRELDGDGSAGAKGAESRRELVAEFNRQREMARRYVWELTIHREALGFRRNDLLHQFYPIPPKRTTFPGVPPPS